LGFWPGRVVGKWGVFGVETIGMGGMLKVICWLHTNKMGIWVWNVRARAWVGNLERVAPTGHSAELPEEPFINVLLFMKYWRCLLCGLAWVYDRVRVSDGRQARRYHWVHQNCGLSHTGAGGGRVV